LADINRKKLVQYEASVDMMWSYPTAPNQLLSQ
jgi:hypothetical protein